MRYVSSLLHIQGDLRNALEFVIQTCRKIVNRCYQNNFKKVTCVTPRKCYSFIGGLVLMEFLLLFAFAVLFAIAFNYGQPKILGKFPSFATNFWGVTLLSAVAVMLLLLIVSWVFAKVGDRAVTVAAVTNSAGA
jgi:hypothetical protein